MTIQIVLKFIAMLTIHFYDIVTHATIHWKIVVIEISNMNIYGDYNNVSHM